MSGTTRTAEAMLHGLKEFNSTFGGRMKNEAQRRMIVFTDGYSQDDPSEVARTLAHEQVHVFSVAVEDINVNPNVEQLKAIASDTKVRKRMRLTILV